MKASLQFEKHIIYLEELLQQTGRELGNFNCTLDTLKVVTLVLEAIRNRLTFEQSIRFVQLLPLSFQAIYLNSWEVQVNKPEKMEKIDDLIDTIIACDRRHLLGKDRKIIKKAIGSVLRVIGNHLSEIDMDTEIGFLPKEIHLYLKDYIIFKYSKTAETESSIWFS